MELKVLIVDDKLKFGKILKGAVENFKSVFPNIFYTPIVIAGFDAYKKASEFIVSNQHEIDIMLIDYNIESNLKGTDLFELVNKSQFLIYKILHSITSKSQYSSKDDFKELYQDFRYSKDDKDITAALINYEKKILDIKLRGNEKFRSTYYISEERLGDEAKAQFEGVRYFDILYAETDGKGKEKVTIHFRNNTTGKNDLKTKEPSHLKDLRDNNLIYKRISSSLLINMLWIAKIDNIKKTIRFISLDNTLLEIPFSPTAFFDSEIKPLLHNLDDIPHFLKL